MKKLLVSEGVPESAIRVEDRSTSTRENALFTKQLLSGSGGRMLLMTSEYHMFRAFRCFQKADFAVVPVPLPDMLKETAHWEGRWTGFLSLADETAKIAYYWLRGWL